MMAPLTRFFRIFLILISLTILGCREQILHNLPEARANDLMSNLHRAGFEVQKERQSDGLWSLSTSASSSIQAIQHLYEARLVREEFKLPETKSTFITSREDQHFRYERALSAELEATIARIPGLLEARVHLNLAKTDAYWGPDQKDKQGSASVLVIAHITSVNTKDLAELVAGATGVSPERVSVLVNTLKPNDFGRGEIKGSSMPTGGNKAKPDISTSYGSSTLWAISGILLFAGGIAIVLFVSLRILKKYSRRGELHAISESL